MDTSKLENNLCVILTLISKIKGWTFKLFQNVAFILLNAILYFYCTKTFGPFQVRSLTFFTFEQVKVFLGMAIVGSLAIFYGPTRGIISIILGQFLVQWKLDIFPTWWLLGVFPLFLLPHYFYGSQKNNTHLDKLAFKVSIVTGYDVLAGAAGFFFFALFGGMDILELVPQWEAFVLSSAISYIPFMIVFSVIFAYLRRPRTIYKSMLTHHPWDDRDHTISIRFGGLVLYLCTRCSGMVMGIVGCLILFDLFPITIAPDIAILLCIILPAPGLFIWSGQKFELWKDMTPSRILNGILLGISIYMLTKTQSLLVQMTIILVIYFVIFYTVLFAGTYYRRKKMQAEFEDLLKEPPVDEKEKTEKVKETRPNPQ